jgi:GT2 family glycosyltransferase
MGLPTFSIIIPTYQSQQIQQTISAIDCQTQPSNIIEVLIVGQQDDLSLPDNSRFRYIRVEKNPSPARNRNVGAFMAKSEWLCFFDSDCVPSNDWFEKVISSLGNDNIYVGAIDLLPDMPYWSWCDHLLSFGKQVNGIYKGKYLKYAATNNMVVRRNLFIQINGFDESYTLPAGEDYDFCTKARLLGENIRFIHHAVVLHNHTRKSFKNSWNHLYLYGESSVRRRIKNNGELTRWHKFIYLLLSIKILGEIIGLGRVLGRAIQRMSSVPNYLKYWKYLPGIFLLDIAHTKGMISHLRSLHSGTRS